MPTFERISEKGLIDISLYIDTCHIAYGNLPAHRQASHPIASGMISSGIASDGLQSGALFSAMAQRQTCNQAQSSAIVAQSLMQIPCNKRH
jgi:hypothetical protein